MGKTSDASSRLDISADLATCVGRVFGIVASIEGRTAGNTITPYRFRINLEDSARPARMRDFRDASYIFARIRA